MEKYRGDNMGNEFIVPVGSVIKEYLEEYHISQKELAEKYLNLFCKKADIPKQLVQAWMPIVACSESVKNKPEEKALLDSWVNVFDFQ